jgi:hypothetical protein
MADQSTQPQYLLIEVFILLFGAIDSLTSRDTHTLSHKHDPTTTPPSIANRIISTPSESDVVSVVIVDEDQGLYIVPIPDPDTITIAALPFT